MDSYITVKGEAVAEIVEKKSRFIASVCHVETEAEALAFLDRIRSENRMARHNVYAYILREDSRVRYSDDGEPQKTAGLPTLEAIQHAGLTDVIVVVTRYFGGILLGTGGLVRAYTQSTQAGLDAAEKVTVSRCVDVIVDISYPLYEQALRVIEESGAKVSRTDFTDEVRLSLLMLEGTEEDLLLKLTELCRGQQRVCVGEPYDAPF